MSLIKLKDIGFGLNGNTLDLVIAIPKDTYLDKFRVYTQKDIANKEKDCSDLGIDYIHNLVQTGFSYKEAFHKVFGKKPIAQYTEEHTQEDYDVYSLANGEYTIKALQEDMTIVSMELFEPNAESCCDINVTVPLYNIITMKLKALEFAKTIKDNCEIPRIFMDKLLQIKAIELALCCGDYCEAAKYWKMFYGSKGSTTIKKCGCHG